MGGLCLGNIAPCLQAVLDADVVGVVVEIAHYYHLRVGVQADDRIFESFYLRGCALA